MSKVGGTRRQLETDLMEGERDRVHLQGLVPGTEALDGDLLEAHRRVWRYVTDLIAILGGSIDREGVRSGRLVV